MVSDSLDLESPDEDSRPDIGADGGPNFKIS